MTRTNEGGGVLVPWSMASHGFLWLMKQGYISTFYISTSSMQSGYRKHLCVLGQKSAQASLSFTSMGERQSLCLFVLELIVFVEAKDRSIQLSF